MATGNSPNPVKIDTSGQYAYVSSAGDGGIYAYTIDQTATALAGQLTAVPGSPF
jgi:6-phosphogluconolactonase (cycloisomerase 2 family)